VNATTLSDDDFQNISNPKFIRAKAMALLDQR
jgi:hypothetical protein